MRTSEYPLCSGNTFFNTLYQTKSQFLNFWYWISAKLILPLCWYEMNYLSTNIVYYHFSSSKGMKQCFVKLYCPEWEKIWFLPAQVFSKNFARRYALVNCSYICLHVFPILSHFDNVFYFQNCIHYLFYLTLQLWLT